MVIHRGTSTSKQTAAATSPRPRGDDGEADATLVPRNGAWFLSACHRLRPRDLQFQSLVPTLPEREALRG